MALDATRANEILTWMHGGAAVTVLTGGTFRRIEFGALQGGAKTMAAGDTLSFAAGAITSALA